MSRPVREPAILLDGIRSDAAIDARRISYLTTDAPPSVADCYWRPLIRVRQRWRTLLSRVRQKWRILIVGHAKWVTVVRTLH
jgi:hypothetical protein